MIAIPVRDRRQGRTEWATLGYGVWLDVIENGADTAWSLDYKGVGRIDKQVRCAPPMSGRVAGTKVSAARLIACARHRQQVRLTDRNPLDLRRDNIHVVGSPVIAGDRVGTAKTDTQASLAHQVQLRSYLAGSSFSIPTAT